MPAHRRHLGYVLKRFPRISETFVASELIELERQGERVSVFAISRPEEPFTHAFLSELRAPVVYLPHRPAREPLRVLCALARVTGRVPRGWLGAARESLWPPRIAGLRRLLQATVLRVELDRAGVDHVHAHFATSAAGLAHLAWRMGGPTYSVTAHAKDIYHSDVRPDRLRDKLGDASFVATVSRRNREHLSTVLGDDRRVRVVSNAVDLQRLGTPQVDGRRPAVVLSVARMIEKKGLGDLVAACGLLAARGVRLRLELAGGGPLRDALEADAARRGVDAVFHGALPHESVLELYRRASVFSLPCVIAQSGDRDGLPTSVLEAMASGVPVVTTGVNGLEEAVIHERTGLLVPQRDPEALAAALERLLAEPELGARLAVAARQHVEAHFSLARSVRLLRTLFPEPA